MDRLSQMFAKLPFLPLSVFAAVAFWGRAEADARFALAFEVAGLLALVQLGILLRGRASVDRLMVGVNLYLMIGAFAFAAHLGGVLGVYSALGFSALLTSIVITGAIATFATPTGFFAIGPADNAYARRYSWRLLGITTVLTLISLALRDSHRWVAIAMFLILVASQRRLQAMVQGRLAGE